jgi:transposase
MENANLLASAVPDLESKPAAEWESPARAAPPQARLKPINRQQSVLRPVEVERLVEEDHPVRAIWELVGRLLPDAFYVGIKAVEGTAGQAAFDPELLTSLWVYAYSRGIGSAREIARLCEYHPAYQWLTGLETVNYHTLSDFRTRHPEALTRLFIEVLGLLSHAGLITLERVMHDGTKIKAFAADNSFRREATLREHLGKAREQVEQLSDPAAEELTQRALQARQRARREKQQRLESALQQLPEIQARTAAAARASSSDPEARIMQSKGGFAPGYNVQISTDAAAKIIVGVGVSQAAADAAELVPAVERIEAYLGQTPQQIVVDQGFTNQATIEAMAATPLDLIGALPDPSTHSEAALRQRGVSPEFFPAAFVYDPVADCYTCPAGQTLAYEGKEKRGTATRYRYRAKSSQCQSCPRKAQCCPQNQQGRSLVRLEDSPTVAAFKAKMRTAAAQTIYKQRAGVAEFPNAWIKAKIGLRQFRLRGRAKVGLEALWACLTYNIQQWIRLVWRPQLPTLQSSLI